MIYLGEREKNTAVLKLVLIFYYYYYSHHLAYNSSTKVLLHQIFNPFKILENMCRKLFYVYFKKYKAVKVLPLNIDTICKLNIVSC